MKKHHIIRKVTLGPGLFFEDMPPHYGYCF
jgi:hypothetical protein